MRTPTLHVHRLLAPVLTAAVLLTACQAAAPSAGPLTEEELADVQSSWDAIVAADRVADWDAVAEYLTEDFVQMDPRSRALLGRDAWRSWVETLELTSSNLEFMTHEIYGHGDLAYLSWSFTGSLMEGEELIGSSGKGLMVLRKEEDGVWRAARNAWNPDPAEVDSPEAVTPASS